MHLNINNNGQCLKIHAFLDGTPGHEKQTQGILKSLAKIIKIEVDFTTVDRTSPSHQLLSWGRYFFSVPGRSDFDNFDYDIMIGTGTHTHLPMLLHKKKSQIPVVSCMSPSTVLVKDFDLLFIPEHDNASIRDNIMTTVGPPSTCENLGRHEDKNILILIGGIDPKSHEWDSEVIVNQIDRLITSDHTRNYCISSSPRTPVETVDSISKLSEQYDNTMFFKFQDTQPGWVENQYNRSKYVWVTGDSISMVYEALSSGCRVGLIPVKWKKKKSKYQRSEEYLTAQGFIVSLETYIEGQACWKNKGILNEANRCAKEIIRRWA